MINFPISVPNNQIDHEVTYCLDVKESVSEMMKVNFGLLWLD